eukprot:Awhi_evm1s10746
MLFWYSVEKDVDFVKKWTENFSDSKDANSGVDVSVRVARKGVNSEVVVVSSNSVALTKLQTSKNLFNCIDKFVFILWEP